jgi:hypothetical protein
MNIKQIKLEKDSENNDAHKSAYHLLLTVLYENYLELLERGIDFYAEQPSTNNSAAVRSGIERETGNIQS